MADQEYLGKHRDPLGRRARKKNRGAEVLGNPLEKVIKAREQLDEEIKKARRDRRRQN